MELISKILDFLKGIRIMDSKHIDEYVEDNKLNVEKVVTLPILGPLFKDDNSRLKQEWTTLADENSELYTLISDLNAFTQKEFKKRIVITMIFRTQEEQDYLYRNSAKYKVRKFKSPHQFWHAVDIRSRNFTSNEIESLVTHINASYDDSNYYKWTSKNHTVGHGMHFHIQFIKS